MDYEEEYKRKPQKEIDAAKRLIEDFKKHEEEINSEFNKEFDSLEEISRRLKAAEQLPQREFISRLTDDYAERNYQIQLKRNEILTELLREITLIREHFIGRDR